MKIFCIKHDRKMDIVQASITTDYEVLIHFECREKIIKHDNAEENCENKINMILDSKHTSHIIKDGVEQM